MPILAPKPFTSSTNAPPRRRRSSSTNNVPPNLTFEYSNHNPRVTGSSSTSGLAERGGSFQGSLGTIPGTPADPSMSLSRSPSPQPSGGWHSPGLTSSKFDGGVASTSSSPRLYGGDYMNGGSSSSNVTWASAQARSANVKGRASHSQNQGFFRHFRRLSSSLPRFSHPGSTHYAEKEKLGRGRWNPHDGDSLRNLVRMIRRIVWRARLRLALVVGFLFFVIVFYSTCKDFLDPLSHNVD